MYNRNDLKTNTQFTVRSECNLIVILLNWYIYKIENWLFRIVL